VTRANLGKAISIDLGAANPCVSVMERETMVVENAVGARTQPSIVAVSDGGEVQVGQSANLRA
jgi:molecular chaperone DnaK